MKSESVSVITGKQEVLEFLRTLPEIIRASNPTLISPSALPTKRVIGGRYFKRVQGKRSASLRERANRRKVAR